MEIKVKKEKEPELKLKKEAQVTVHKKNPILSAKEKKAAFTSKPVADLLGQRKKKKGQKKGNSRSRTEKRCLKNKRKRKSKPGKRLQSGEQQKVENKMESPKVPYLYQEPYRRIR